MYLYAVFQYAVFHCMTFDTSLQEASEAPASAQRDSDSSYVQKMKLWERQQRLVSFVFGGMHTAAEGSTNDNLTPAFSGVPFDKVSPYKYNYIKLNHLSII